jgi:hypothetical protein
MEFSHTRRHFHRSIPGQLPPENARRKSPRSIPSDVPDDGDPGGPSSGDGELDVEYLLDMMDVIVGTHMEQVVAKLFLLLGPLYKGAGVEIPGTMKITWVDPGDGETPQI